MIILHVYSPAEREFTTMRRGYINGVAEIIERELRDMQNKGISQQVEAVQVHAELAEGHAAEEIIRYADRQHVSLILMATHGRSGIRRWAIGSIADKVVRATRRPVLLIRTKPGYEISNKVVIPLDGSKESEAVVGFVQEIASGLNSQVILLQVLEQSYQLHTAGGRSIQVRYSNERMEHLQNGAKRYLEGIVNQLKGKGISATSEVKIGTPAVEIINFGKETQARMVAMLKRRRFGISPLDLGNVADKVLRRGTTPVMLFSAPGRAKHKE